MNKPLKRTGWLSLLALSVTSQVFAGGVSLPDIQQNLPRPVLPEPRPIIQVPDETPAPEKKQKKSSLKIVVNAFKFSGNKQFSNEILSAQLAHLTGREIGMRELNEAVGTVRNYYRQRGYMLTQVYLPTQDLQKTTDAGAEVELSILEGTLGEVKAEAGQGLDQAYFQSLSEYGLNKGDVLNERNLVRNIMVMNGLPGIQVTSQLNPGEAVGSSDVAVSVEPRTRFSGFVSANNYGNRFTNRETLGFGMALNNLNGRGDQLAVVGKVSRDEGQRSLSSLYFTPVGSAGTIMNLAYSYVDYKLGSDFKQFDASGDAHYFFASLEHPLMRETKKGVAFKVGSNYKILDDDVRAFAINNRRDISSLELGFVGDWINDSGNVVYQWSLLATGGNVSYKDSQAKATDRSLLDTQGSFIKWNWTSSRTQVFDNGVNWIVRADYQGAGNNLDIAERFGIGAINRWRQFSEIPSQADQGWMVGTDVRKTFATTGADVTPYIQSVTPFAFFDAGRGKLNHDPVGSSTYVRSNMVGLGTDIQFPGQWILTTTYSQQKRDLDNAASNTEFQLWAQLRKNF
ncbi:ShlB/FhaC/HecB family hemolysin secretion/activation protein [Methylophilus medardicus]|uniref:ShlB/FhaC/HecB family hemolysin secretion/activation protein n=1 Tax=Methylophilus medardicus TaxID=2588534 RepID=A0A5B8CV71_9PROT|nr:ShlB/FhaC/HecB family hemolysin secretion/activation protein [Methylophilus medardicus]QDC45198.1 ShlB/FhaC/HecB family hemolysin secretion/activation protein [Methylophilus medardicus]QDC50205.1 ShlB/FhaC/HecB family hemolysin secretion/activation protein [Methylophilus medardicus]QDC53910.1 ShlB/FhaC/HecB family hemolysin secretion/activation protein [Methylophilus medardicus]